MPSGGRRRFPMNVLTNSFRCRNEAGQLSNRYRIYSCWVSEYQALPDVDANGNAVAIQHITLKRGVAP